MRALVRHGDSVRNDAWGGGTFNRWRSNFCSTLRGKLSAVRVMPSAATSLNPQNRSAPMAARATLQVPDNPAAVGAADEIAGTEHGSIIRQEAQMAVFGHHRGVGGGRLGRCRRCRAVSHQILLYAQRCAENRNNSGLPTSAVPVIVRHSAKPPATTPPRGTTHPSCNFTGS